MLALAVAVELGLDITQAAAALREVTLPAGRSEVLRLKGLTVVHDAYNANPASLAAALQAVDAMRQGRRLVVVVGTMLELGAETERRHAELADAVLALQPDLIAAVGEFVPALERHAEVADRLITAPDAEALGPRLAARLQGNELVLLKASRGVRHERVLPYLSSL